MKRVTLLLCATLPLLADSRSTQTTTTIQGGVFQYATFVATGGLSAVWPVTATPDPALQANVVQVSCSGTGVATYSGSFNVGPAATVINIPVTLTSSNGTETCTLNFANSSETYTSTQVTVTVSQVALSFASTNAESQFDPVSTSSGELFEAPPPDLSLGGLLHLQFLRGYGSFINSSRLTTTMGANWTNGFDWELTVNSAGTQATVTLFGSETVNFVQSASGTTWTLATPERYGYQFAQTVTGDTNTPSTYQFLDPRTNLIYSFSGTTGTPALAAIQDRNGNTLAISPLNASYTYFNDGIGRYLILTYDPKSGNLTKVTDQTGRDVLFSYTNGNLTQFIDANGNSHSYSYTSAFGVPALMTRHTWPLGNTHFTNTFDNIGRVSTQTDAAGNVSSFTYDKPVGTTAFEDGSGATNSDFSRAYSDLLTHTDPDKQSLTVTYDANSHRSSVVDRLGDKITAMYHSPSGYLASITDALGRATTFTWTAQTAGPFTFYNLTGVGYPDGTSAAYTYDSSGNLLTAVDQAGQTSKFTYNSLGQVVSESDPDGHLTAYTYNSDATVASVTDAAGNTATYNYDGLKRINQVRLADGNTRSFMYDNLDHLISSANEAGQVTASSYDFNGNLQSRTDPHGESTNFTYNTQDLVKSKTDRTLDTTTYAYDSNNLLKSVTMPAGETYSVTRDAHRRVTASTDPAGNSTTFGYNKEDGIISISDALSRTTSIARDALGRETRLTTPLGENYTAAYDSFSRITSLTDPDGVATAFTYNTRGLATSVSTGGFSTALTYDAAGLLTASTDPNGNAWNYTYDSAGRLASLADPLNRARTYTYNNRNEVTGVQLPSGSVNFSYDPIGNLTQRSYSDGTAITYTYDPVDGVKAATGVTLAFDFEGRITGSNGLIIGRDADGRISSITYAPNKTVKYAYNSAGLLASVTDWISGATALRYDTAHELTALTRPNNLGTQYGYDQDGRVVTLAEDAGPAITIQRDAAGRVIEENRVNAQAVAMAPGTLPLSYDPAEQVASYTYDANGRVVSDSLRSYTWDLASRLKSYSGADGAASAEYDGFGLRTSLTNAAGTENFVWNYATTIPSLAIVRNALGDAEYYVYSPDGKLLYAIDAVTNARHYYHFDENGSTTLLTDDSGAITDSYGITPYGENVTHNGSSANPFTWQGQWGAMQEGSTSLFYMRTRYYDSTSARFLSPAANSPVGNPYAYAPGSGNPKLPDFSHQPESRLVITRYFKPAELLARGLSLLPKAPEVRGIAELTHALDNPLGAAHTFNPFETPAAEEFRFLPFISGAAETIDEFYRPPGNR